MNQKENLSFCTISIPIYNSIIKVSVFSHQYTLNYLGLTDSGVLNRTNLLMYAYPYVRVRGASPFCSFVAIIYLNDCIFETRNL